MIYDRRQLILGGGTALAAGVMSMKFAGAQTQSNGASNIVVETTSGKVRGTRAADVCSFLGVPYGSAKRFMPPKAPNPWSGIRDAVALGPRAPQFEVPPGALPPSMAGLVSFAHEPTSEDCLVLNVWTPNPDNRKRPVMVWFHGGGFAVGSGQEPDYHGANLARKNDVVVVTVNHRINVFGFCYLARTAGPEFAESGNVGMLDLVQSLTWARDNISHFGGDPANVTIFGQSGGGAKVSVMLAMPSAKGLYHKAIIMSGPGVRVKEPDQAEANTNKLLTALGLGKKDIDQLLALPMQELIKATGMPLAGAGMGIDFSPVTDGVVLPSQPFDPVAPEVSATIPIIIGHTRDEMAMMMVPDIVANKLTDAELAQRVEGIAQGRSHEILTAYRQLRPEATPIQIWADVVSDRGMGAGTILLADRKVKQARAPLFMYLVTYEVPALGGALRASHGEDMALVFDNVGGAAGLHGTGPRAQQMADMMSRAWVAFARAGKPDHRGIPHWPRYTLERRETLIFDIPPRVANDPQARERALWAGAWSPVM
jgi:para-nitrobenzyl esterase